jgi:hypothetical protein
VLPLLTEALDCNWGLLTKFHGTEAELVAAGLVDADIFQNMGASTQRTRETGFGDRYTINRRRGKWDLSISNNRENTTAPSDEYPRPSAWWKKHGGESEAEMRRILAAFRRRT